MSLSWPAHSSDAAPLPVLAYSIEYYSPEWPATSGWTLLQANIVANANTTTSSSSSSSSSVSFTVSERLEADTFYTFVVRARNELGVGPPSQPSDLIRTLPLPLSNGGGDGQAEKEATSRSSGVSRDLVEKALLAADLVQVDEPVRVLDAWSLNVTWRVHRASLFIDGFRVKYRPLGAKHAPRVLTLDDGAVRHSLIANLSAHTVYEVWIEPFANDYPSTHKTG